MLVENLKSNLGNIKKRLFEPYAARLTALDERYPVGQLRLGADERLRIFEPVADSSF